MPVKNDKGFITGDVDAAAFVAPATILYVLTKPYYGGYDKVKGQWLYDVVCNTPERLLFHELGHGWSAFGEFTTADYNYGWNDVVLRAQTQAVNNNVNDYLPLKNADTFALWAGGEY
ncbi:hypothetical protein N7537_001748 [Penicillium hordei]|uniref:Uncharacterized protein n=1 Tax=Penicillium hordei TaxID=40994 RepID=A0AAD6H907_9EURO|nr:uncharacterized protein N7537_001748 [Penicillium hordei]KAJ5616634.1 hypothetical protein N7537_001748 [Penicillium hordei]